MGMAGLDEWITGHYGADQYDDLFCPECGANIDQVGTEEVEGHFASGVAIFKCGSCKALVQDGEYLNKTEARERFA